MNTFKTSYHKHSAFVCLLLFTTLFLYNTVYAQQLPQFSNTLYYMESVNPGHLSDDRLKIDVIGRSQWVGIPKNPRTLYTNISTNLERINSSIAFQTFHDDLKLERNLVAKICYSYYFSIKKIGTIQAGVGTGIGKKSTNGLWIAVDPNDPYIPPVGSQTTFRLDAGVKYNSTDERITVGIAVNQLNSPNYDRLYLNAVPHYYLYGQYKFVLAQEKLSIIPSVIISSDKSSTQYTGLVMTTYNDKYSIGFGYRHQDAIIFAAGFNLNKFSFRYAYDLTTSILNQQSNGSHELGLSFRLAKKES